MNRRNIQTVKEADSMWGRVYLSNKEKGEEELSRICVCLCVYVCAQLNLNVYIRPRVRSFKSLTGRE